MQLNSMITAMMRKATSTKKGAASISSTAPERKQDVKETTAASTNGASNTCEKLVYRKEKQAPPSMISISREEVILELERLAHVWDNHPIHCCMSDTLREAARLLRE